MRPRLRRDSSLRAPVTPWGTGSRMRAEMERLSANPRHFHLFLEYSTLGVRTPGIRRKVRGGLETYRAGFLALAEEVLPDAASPPADASTASTAATLSTAEGLAGVAVSLAHGCALRP